jgi:hypothetical protein
MLFCESANGYEQTASMLRARTEPRVIYYYDGHPDFELAMYWRGLANTR